MTSLSLEVGAGPAKASIATAHLGETGKHTTGLSTCIVVSKTCLYLYLSTTMMVTEEEEDVDDDADNDDASGR